MGYSPPPFQPEAQKPKSSTGLAVGVTILAILLVVGMCGGLVWAAMSAVGSMGKMVSEVAQCPVAFELTTNATLAYAKEHGNTLPKAETWQKDISPYYNRLRDKFLADTKKVPVFKFTAPGIDEALPCAFGQPVTGIWLNKEVAGKKLDAIKNPDTTVLFFEGDKPTLNGSAVYKEQKAEASPKFLGESRSWVKTFVSGNQDFLETKDSNSSFDISIDDALTPRGEGISGPAADPKAEVKPEGGN